MSPPVFKEPEKTEPLCLKQGSRKETGRPVGLSIIDKMVYDQDRI